MNDTAKIKLQETINKIEGAYAPSTIRAFNADFSSYINFCENNNKDALPTQPSTLATYVEHLTHKKYSSSYIRRILVAISAIHRLNRFEDPTKDPDVRLAMRRMHRQLGRASHQALGVTIDILNQMMEATSNDLRGIRDRALLCVSYDTLSRRGELVSLRIEDMEIIKVKEKEETARILLIKSKTDQESRGKWLYLKPSTYQLLKVWVNKAKLNTGLIFRGIRGNGVVTKKLCSGQVCRIYKKLAMRSGIEIKKIRKISSHSTRVGAAQDLLNSGASLPMIMTKGRWSKTETVMYYLNKAHVKIN